MPRYVGSVKSVVNKKSDQGCHKMTTFCKILHFLKKKSLPIRCGMGVWHYTSPTGQKRYIKWSYFNFRSRSVAKAHKFFPGRFRAWIGLKTELEEGSITTYLQDGFLGSPGHQNSSLRGAQPVHYFSMVLN